MSMQLSELNDLINLRRYLFDASNGFFAGVRKDQIREINELVRKIDVLIISNASNTFERVVSGTMEKKVVKPVSIKSVSNAGLPTHVEHVQHTFSSNEDEYAKSLAIIEAARKAGLINPPPNAQRSPTPVSPATPGEVMAVTTNRNGSVVVQGETFAADLNKPHDFTKAILAQDDGDEFDEGEDPNLQLDDEHTAIDPVLLATMEQAKQIHVEQVAEPTGVIVSKKARGATVKRVHESR